MNSSLQMFFGQIRQRVQNAPSGLTHAQVNNLALQARLMLFVLFMRVCLIIPTQSLEHGVKHSAMIIDLLTRARQQFQQHNLIKGVRSRL